MATLYIIGNGFDIAHGLDTSYWNFRSYLEMRDYEFLLSFEKMYDIEPLDETEYGYTIDAQKKWEKHIKEILWSEFERCMGNPNIQSMLDFSSSILEDLNLETGNVGIFDTTIQIVVNVASVYGRICGDPINHKEINTDIVTPMNHANNFQTI